MTDIPSGPRAWSALAVAAALVLAACGGSDGDAGHAAERVDSAGLLALTEAGKTTVRLLDLDKGAVTHSLATAAAPSAIVTSPGGRYALAVQRLQDGVQVIDGGLWQEDHGDHLHDYRAAPKLLAGALTGPRPTHYEVKDGMGALFMDGNADAATPAAVQVLTEASLAKGTADSQFTLPAAVHGTAEPRGADAMLVSARTADAPGTLPNVVDLYQRSASGWKVAQRFEARCPELHGSYSNATHSVFGCADGVLVIEQKGAQFSASKIAHPPGMPEKARIGTLSGHAKLAKFIGLASPGHVFEIDPARAAITPITWAEGRTRRAHSFDRTGKHFVLLDDTGATHWLEAGANWRVAKTVPVIAQMPTAAPFPTLVSSRARDALYVTDVNARQIAVLDSQAPAVAQRLNLGFAPSAQAWLGIAAP
ncbi:hypothetical protein [Ottowia testudinis]|uniref:Uncharacterized protein n=1 Tax=Ottowia testudinis TaxID=2816950 RepID=A0A975CDK6_9BURK|nr:hypothetical protein [Ottowia testudinis]QTD43902.1 hypothetical protein J1M35_12180 [Ottowia testudinis]